MVGRQPLARQARHRPPPRRTHHRTTAAPRPAMLLHQRRLLHQVLHRQTTRLPINPPPTTMPMPTPMPITKAALLQMPPMELATMEATEQPVPTPAAITTITAPSMPRAAPSYHNKHQPPVAQFPPRLVRLQLPHRRRRRLLLRAFFLLPRHRKLAQKGLRVLQQQPWA